VPALILDCDGVLAETERELHLPAFNQAFAEFGLPLRWTDEEYGERLRIAGGKERMAASFTPELMEALGLPFEPASVRALAAAVHERKTELVAQALASSPPRARPGVRRLLDAARRAGWKLAIASTSSEDSVRRVAEGAVGPGLSESLLVLAGDVVAAKKPDAAIYELAVERLRVPKADAIVVEDSRIGLLAAAGAGLACVITVSEYTAGEDFGEAPLVLSSLGDPAQPLTVLANRSSISPGGQLTLDDLRALARDGRPRPRDDGA
jgi:HAD superfamily hydrolase (TIGR01509 family)